jgi:hypothetical protein
MRVPARHSGTNSQVSTVASTRWPETFLVAGTPS